MMLGYAKVVMLAAWLAVGLWAGMPAAPACAGEFSHALWDSVLHRYVHAGWVDYRDLVRNRGELDRYVAQLAGARLEELHHRDDSLAFYINAYNALAVKGVVDRYPIQSVLRLRRGWLSRVPTASFFRTPQPLAGGMITLDGIERGILRARFNEPRSHFALVCASKSCPPLRSSAYVPDSLDRQLDSQAELFINDASRNRWDARARVFYVSAIFRWARSDFEASGGVHRWLHRYHRGRLPAGDFAIRYLKYDWNLNGR